MKFPKDRIRAKQRLLSVPSASCSIKRKRSTVETYLHGVVVQVLNLFTYMTLEALHDDIGLIEFSSHLIDLSKHQLILWEGVQEILDPIIDDQITAQRG